VERLGDPGDARVSRLRLSPAAEERLRRWRDRRGEVLASRLAGLGVEDRRAVALALPVLERIALSLEASSPPHAPISDPRSPAVPLPESLVAHAH
jgi:hypothetical protein